MSLTFAVSGKEGVTQQLTDSHAQIYIFIKVIFSDTLTRGMLGWATTKCQLYRIRLCELYDL